MKPSGTNSLPTKYQLLLVLLALIGALFVFLSTNRYGAGLSPDSVGYISSAQNITKGLGVTSYDGTALVVQPPLYPALLALISKITGAAPLLFAHILNAFLFGLIVYLGGVLTFKYLPSYPIFALVGTLTIVFSIPLFRVSGWAWSELPFITFMLLAFIFAHSYIVKNDLTSLILLSSSVALSCLTRYIGVTLILWGGLTILIFHRDSLKNRIAHFSLFTLISALPLGLWLIRNYAVSNTLLGPRASSAFTLSQNLTFTFDTLWYWYIPRTIGKHRSILMIVSAGTCLLVFAAIRDSWQSVKAALRQILPIALFTPIYTSFLIYTSTTVAYDKIGDRLLSPIYVPLTLLLLILAQMLVDPFRKRISKKVINSFLTIFIVIWLVYLIRFTVPSAVERYHTGQGYSSKAWVESPTVQYLLEHRRLESDCTFYTNAPDVVYVLANLTSKISLVKTSNSSETDNGISTLKGSWPTENNVCMIWFDQVNRTYLFTIDELQTIANMDLIARLEDGVIYAITRK